MQMLLSPGFLSRLTVRLGKSVYDWGLAVCAATMQGASVCGHVRGQRAEAGQRR